MKRLRSLLKPDPQSRDGVAGGAAPPAPPAARFAAGSAVLCMTLGVLVLAGWALDLAVLTSVFPDYPTMKANVAAGFLLSGLALLHIARHGSGDGMARAGAMAAAAAVAAIGALSLSEHLVGWDLGIDQLLVTEPHVGAPAHPGRMALNTAIALTVAGLTLLQLLRRGDERAWRTGWSVTKGGASVVFVIGLAAWLSYATEISAVQRWGTLAGGSVHASVGLMALGAGLFAAAWRRAGRRWALDRVASIALGGVLAATAALVGATYHVTEDLDEATSTMKALNEVRFRGSELLSAVHDVESAAHAFALTGAEPYRSVHDAAARRVPLALDALRRLVAGQPLRWVEGPMDSLIATQAAHARDVIARRDALGKRAALPVDQNDVTAADGIRSRVTLLDAHVLRLMREQDAAAATAARNAFVVLPIIGVLAFLALLWTLLALNREAVARTVATEAARRSDDELRAAFEQTAIGLALNAPDGRFLRVNQQLADLLGYDRGELETLRVRHITHPDDLETNRALARQALDAVLNNYSIDQRFVRKDGTELWVNLTVSVVRHGAGEPTHFIAAVKDITERRRMAAALAESEERFRLAAAATSDVVWDWHVGSEDVWRSKDWPSHLGYGVNDAPTRGWWISHIHPDDRDRVRRELDAALVPPVTLWESQYRFLRADGSHATVKERAFVVRGEDGRAIRVVGSTADISRQVELASELAHAQRLETVGQLAGGVAHDFNNLLTVILGTADLAAQHGMASDEQREELALIRQTALRAADLTRNLLAFSRRQVLQPKVSNLNGVIDSTLPMLRRLIGEHVRISLQLEPALDHIFVDETQLQQVLLNLAVNGRDAMPGGGTLTIATERVMVDEAYAAGHPGTAPGAHVALVVSDDGGGMDMATQQRIFEPFFTTKEPGKGTGLGLATVFGIVKQSGGSISVYSAPGEGTTFRSHFPGVEAPAIAPAPAAPKPARTVDGAVILVVEDDDYLRRLTATMLKRLGCTTLVAAGGNEALRVLAEHPGRVDLVLTDLVMQGMSGVHLAERLAVARPATKVLFTSGYGGDAAGSVFEIPEAAKFLPKPFTFEDLSGMILETLAA